MREIADEVGAVLMVDMAHFAGLVAGKVFTGDFDPVPHAHVTTTTTHKSLRGPRGGLVLCQPEFADCRRPRLPDGARRPARARHGGQGGGAGRGAPARRSGPTRAAVADNAVALADGLMRRGVRLVTGGTENHLVLLDVTIVRAHRPAGRVGAARLRHRHQPQRDPARPERRLVHLRRPDRHAGADLARLRRRRLRPRRRADGRRAGRHHAAAAASGAASKAKYAIADGVADKTHAAAEELLAANPLYPGLDLG